MRRRGEHGVPVLFVFFSVTMWRTLGVVRGTPCDDECPPARPKCSEADEEVVWIHTHLLALSPFFLIQSIPCLERERDSFNYSTRPFSFDSLLIVSPDLSLCPSIPRGGCSAFQGGVWLRCRGLAHAWAAGRCRNPPRLSLPPTVYIPFVSAL